MLEIHLWQARSLGVDWDSFLRNTTFCKVLAQKDRNHCWIYFPPHSCLWASRKPCSPVSCPWRPLSFYSPLDLTTFVFTPRDLFFPLLFSLIAVTCQLAEHFLSLTLQGNQLRKKCLPAHSIVTNPLFFTIALSYTFPQIRPSSRFPLEPS